MDRLRSNSFAYLIALGLACAATAALFLVGSSESVLLAIAAALYVALLVAAICSADLALYAFVLVALTEALYKGLAANMLTMLAKDIVLAIMLLRLFWHSQQNRDYSWLRHPLALPGLLLAAYGLAMAAAPQTNSLLLAAAGLRSWLLWMPLYFPAYQTLVSRRRVFAFISILLLVMVPICVYGIVQGNIGYEHTRVLPGFYELTSWYGVNSLRSDEDVLGAELTGDYGRQPSPEQPESFDRSFAPIMAVRACAIFISPGYFGGMAAMTALLSLGLLGWARSSVLRGLAVAAALAAVGGLLASGSRAPMVGLVVGLAAMSLVSRRRALVIAGAIVVGLGTLYVLRDVVGVGAQRIERTLTVSAAIQRSLQPLGFGLQAAWENPLGGGVATGQGAGRLVYTGAIQVERSQGARFIENEFGRALAELGFVGTALWLWMIITPLVQTFRCTRRLGSQRAGVLVAAMFGAMVAIFTQLGVGSALYQGAGMFYYVFAAMAQRLVELPITDNRRAVGAALRRYGFVRERVHLPAQ